MWKKVAVEGLSGGHKMLQAANSMVVSSHVPQKLLSSSGSKAVLYVATKKNDFDSSKFGDRAEGIQMPLTIVEIGTKLGKSASQSYLAEVAQASNPIYGYGSTLTPFDHMKPLPDEYGIKGGGLSLRELKNLVNAVPVAIQQASLNLGTIALLQKRSSSRYVMIAAETASDVGRMWDDLPSRTMSLFSFNTLGATTGVVHLFEDVQRMIVQRGFELSMGKPLNETEVYEFIKGIGGAGEIAKHAALGALESTQQFLKDFPKEVPIYGSSGILPAKLFFSPTAIEIAVTVRDERIVDLIGEVARQQYKVPLKREAIEEALEHGRKAATKDGSVAEVAELTAKLGNSLQDEALQKFSE